MTYRVRVLCFESPRLNTFAEAWALLISEFYKLPVTMKSEQMIQGSVCWIQRGDGMTFRIDDVRGIASALGLISGEGEGFMFLTNVPTERAMKIEPLAHGLIEQRLVQKAVQRWLLEEIEEMRQAIIKRPTARSLSSEEVGAETDQLAMLRLRVEQMRTEYEKAMGR